MRKTTFKGQLLRLNNTRETRAVKLSTKMRDKVILQSIYSLSLPVMFYSVGYLAPVPQTVLQGARCGELWVELCCVLPVSSFCWARGRAGRRHFTIRKSEYLTLKGSKTKPDWKTHKVRISPFYSDIRTFIHLNVALFVRLECDDSEGRWVDDTRMTPRVSAQWWVTIYWVAAVLHRAGGFARTPAS